MDWIMYTVGTVAHIWTAMVVLGLILVGRDSVTNRVRISPWRIFTPLVLTLAYWNWFFFA
jgi:hypothetical protein